MKTTFKQLSIGTATTIALALAQQTASATPITGSISFSGSVTPYLSTSGTGPTASTYDQAHSLVFGQSTVAAGADGSFAGVLQGTPVAIYSPLLINPTALPSPTTTPLWTTSAGGFTFTLSSLTEDTLLSPFNSLTLRGIGTISDGNPADNTTGGWVATFTLANAGSGTSFSWNSSTAAQGPVTNGAPDAGATVALLGLGFLSLGAFGYVRKNVA